MGQITSYDTCQFSIHAVNKCFDWFDYSCVLSCFRHSWTVTTISIYKKDSYRQLNVRQLGSLRPWDNRGKCYMDRKRIQCLSNASQHVHTYLQPFTSYSEILVDRKSQLFPTPLHLTPPYGVAPGTIAVNSHGWKEDSMLVKRFAVGYISIYLQPFPSNQAWSLKIRHFSTFFAHFGLPCVRPSDNRGKYIE